MPSRLTGFEMELGRPPPDVSSPVLDTRKVPTTPARPEWVKNSGGSGSETRPSSKATGREAEKRSK